jgi:tetratricopeptide (TPR) repeat protein
MYVVESDNRGKMNLTIEYEIYNPNKEILQFFGIITCTWINIRLRFRNYREKMISQIYDLLNPGFHEKDGKERCKDCKSLKNRVKTSDALLYEVEEICPSCLNALSTKISRLQRKVESITADSNQHTKNHDSLMDKIDSAIVSSIKMQDDTSKLYLGYLKSKLMISTTKYYNQGLQAMNQIFELISDYDYLKNLNLPPDFDEHVENSLINGFVRNKQHTEALKIAEIGYDLNRKANNTFKMAKSLNQMSEIYLALNQYDDAEQCAERSYDLHVKNRFSGKSLEKSAEILTRIYKIKNREDKIQNVKLHRFF